MTPPLWTAVPFLLLLLAIALLPVLAGHFWEKHLNKGSVCALLALPVLVWLLVHAPGELHHSLREYLSFIILLGSLFAISGGVSIGGDLKATPKVNTAFLATGALLANLIGTTGASMVLIRPFLNTNSERKNTGHLPLFLGYLRGVPFFWTLRLLPVWLTVNGLLLLIFYWIDRRAYATESREALRKDRGAILPLRIEGRRNLLFLAGVVGAAFFASPWREGTMLSLTALGYFLGSRSARWHNRFSWGPIVEVATLFAGIFVTMVPALMLLREHAPQFGIVRPWQFFWMTGSLSAFLDNAPTYLTFLSIAQGLNLGGEVVGIPAKILEAISCGAVLMGANTYIGNGPNFMVKAIADRRGFRTPSFFGYFGKALLILSPVYLLVTWLFFV